MCTKKAHGSKGPQDRISVRTSLGTLPSALKWKGWTKERSPWWSLHFMICQCNFSGGFCISRHLCTPCLFQHHPLKGQMKVFSCSSLVLFSSELFGSELLANAPVSGDSEHCSPMLSVAPFWLERVGKKDTLSSLFQPDMCNLHSPQPWQLQIRIDQECSHFLQDALCTQQRKGSQESFSTRRASHTASLCDQVLLCQGWGEGTPTFPWQWSYPFSAIV